MFNFGIYYTVAGNFFLDEERSAKVCSKGMQAFLPIFRFYQIVYTGMFNVALDIPLLNLTNISIYLFVSNTADISCAFYIHSL